MIKPETILWIYIVLLVIGGLIGFLKAKSKISLITSILFAVILGFVAVDQPKPIFSVEWSWGILSFLALIFFIRLLRTKKFMPSGMMLLITAVAIISMVWLK
jgi:uncharacterized membrane protein (UPF0136 family)